MFELKFPKYKKIIITSSSVERISVMTILSILIYAVQNAYFSLFLVLQRKKLKLLDKLSIF